MKKDWLQIATLCLCAILLVITITQGKRLDEYQRQTQSGMETLSESVGHKIQGIEDRIQWEMEEAGRSVSEYALTPVGVDKENRALLASLSVTLKEWYEDTEVTLLAMVGGENISFPMAADGTGAFTGRLSLPLEDSDEIFLSTLISGGGLTKQETLGGWQSVAMLLPLQDSGGGWSGPNYREGVMSSRYHIAITGQTGKPGPIQNPKFLIYKNGALTQTLEAVVDPHASASDGVCYTVDTEQNIWSLECSIDDIIDIHFRCEDEYGLGYDFPFQTWSAAGETVEGQASAVGQPGSSKLTLYWPE